MPAERPQDAHIFVHNLTMAYGSLVIQRDLTFRMQRGDIFIIMGGSGCGKSTLLRHLVGLQTPAQGDVLYDGQSLWQVEPAERERMMRCFGVLYQSGALWSSMTLAENIALPLEQYTDLSPSQIGELVSLKLALVGLAGFEDYYPSALSGGMQCGHSASAVGAAATSAVVTGIVWIIVSDAVLTITYNILGI